MINLDDYRDLDAVALSTAVRSGQLSVPDVLAAARAAYARTHDTINAVVEWFDDPTLPTADALGGPLAGVPVLCKDYGSAEAGRLVEMGSRIMAGNRAESTAPFMARLQAAGAVLVGRSTVPEFIQHGTTESVATGLTRNPHDLSVSAGGSSGGAAAAVAAGIVPVGHASDCAGSIRIPAAVCGLVGLKPAPGAVAWPAGDWDGIASEFVVTRTARDAALFLDVLADDLPAAATGPLRIALSTDHWAGVATDAVVVNTTQDVARHLESLGHSVESVAPPVDYQTLMSTWHPLFSRWVVQHALEAADRFQRPLDATMLEPMTLGLLREVGQLSAADYRAAQATRAVVGSQLDEAMQRFDLLLTPSLGRPVIPLNQVGGTVASVANYLELNDALFPYHYLFNVVGWAASSIPAGTTADGHPLGVQLAGRPGTERTILRLAMQLGH